MSSIKISSFDEITAQVTKMNSDFNNYVQLKLGILPFFYFNELTFERIISQSPRDNNTNEKYLVKIKATNNLIMSFFKTWTVDSYALKFSFTSQSNLSDDIQKMLETTPSLLTNNLKQLPEVLAWYNSVDPSVLNEFQQLMLKCNTDVLRTSIASIQSNLESFKLIKFEALFAEIETKVNQLFADLYKKNSYRISIFKDGSFINICMLNPNNGEYSTELVVGLQNFVNLDLETPVFNYLKFLYEFMDRVDDGRYEEI